MQNAELNPQVRAGAIRAYLRVAGEAGVPTLLQVLSAEDRAVAAAAAAALGHVGTPDERPRCRPPARATVMNCSTVEPHLPRR